MGGDPNAAAAFTSNTNKLVMDIIGGKLGQGISEGDRQFIQSMTPTLNETKEQRASKLQSLRSFMNFKSKQYKDLHQSLTSGDLWKPDTDVSSDPGISVDGAAPALNGWSIKKKGP